MTLPVPAQPLDLRQLLTLQQVAKDFFVGQTPAYEWGRVYGGQVVAQGLAAATATVHPEHRLHSVHAYFVLSGTPQEPILYDVDRLRDGRSFSTRRVVARQSAGAILNLDASFQRDEPGLDISETGLEDDLPDPESLPRAQWNGLGDVREVPNQPGQARSRMWIRATDDLGDSPALHACALAYLTDHNPIDAIAMSHPLGLDWDKLMTASLDHAVWLHRPARADQWLLFDMRGHGLVNARGMATGTVHTRDGAHVATIAQEGLVRVAREPRSRPASG
ncbi:MAG: acyl-CoA thioesterase [Acidimicrobiales bacterium]